MEYKRSDRIADLLLELVSHLLAKEVKDPRIGTVTLTGVDVSKDLRHARIYFSLLTREEGKEEVLAGLKSATGFIRGKIAKALKLRFVPTIDFFYDDTEAQARHIEDLLNQAKQGES